MREIKFRVYDKLNKEYINPAYVHIDLRTGKIYKVVSVSVDSGLSGGLVEVPNQERYVLEQYTGLKLKNGKEIYEGDIVRALYHGFNEYGNFKCEYKTEKQGFRFINTTNENDGWYALKRSNDIEIIGNIHKGVENNG